MIHFVPVPMHSSYILCCSVHSHSTHDIRWSHFILVFDCSIHSCCPYILLLHSFYSTCLPFTPFISLMIPIVHFLPILPITILFVVTICCSLFWWYFWLFHLITSILNWWWSIHSIHSIRLFHVYSIRHSVIRTIPMIEPFYIPLFIDTSDDDESWLHPDWLLPFYTFYSIHSIQFDVIDSLFILTVHSFILPVLFFYHVHCWYGTIFYSIRYSFIPILQYSLRVVVLRWWYCLIHYRYFPRDVCSLFVRCSIPFNFCSVVDAFVLGWLSGVHSLLFYVKVIARFVFWFRCIHSVPVHFISFTDFWYRYRSYLPFRSTPDFTAIRSHSITYIPFRYPYPFPVRFTDADTIRWQFDYTYRSTVDLQEPTDTIPCYCSTFDRCWSFVSTYHRWYRYYHDSTCSTFYLPFYGTSDHRFHSYHRSFHSPPWWWWFYRWWCSFWLQFHLTILFHSIHSFIVRFDLFIRCIRFLHSILDSIPFIRFHIRWFHHDSFISFHSFIHSIRLIPFDCSIPFHSFHSDLHSFWCWYILTHSHSFLPLLTVHSTTIRPVPTTYVFDVLTIHLYIPTLIHYYLPFWFYHSTMPILDTIHSLHSTMTVDTFVLPFVVDVIPVCSTIPLFVDSFWPTFILFIIRWYIRFHSHCCCSTFVHLRYIHSTILPTFDDDTDHDCSFYKLFSIHWRYSTIRRWAFSWWYRSVVLLFICSYTLFIVTHCLHCYIHSHDTTWYYHSIYIRYLLILFVPHLFCSMMMMLLLHFPFLITMTVVDCSFCWLRYRWCCSYHHDFNFTFHLFYISTFYLHFILLFILFVFYHTRWSCLFDYRLPSIHSYPTRYRCYGVSDTGDYHSFLPFTFYSTTFLVIVDDFILIFHLLFILPFGITLLLFVPIRFLHSTGDHFDIPSGIYLPYRYHSPPVWWYIPPFLHLRWLPIHFVQIPSTTIPTILFCSTFPTGDTTYHIWWKYIVDHSMLRYTDVYDTWWRRLPFDTVTMIHFIGVLCSVCSTISTDYRYEFSLRYITFISHSCVHSTDVTHSVHFIHISVLRFILLHLFWLHLSLMPFPLIPRCHSTDSTGIYRYYLHTYFCSTIRYDRSLHLRWYRYLRISITGEYLPFYTVPPPRCSILRCIPRLPCSADSFTLPLMRTVPRYTSHTDTDVCYILGWLF